MRMTPQDLGFIERTVVCCVDVGSPKKKNVGWAVVRGTEVLTGTNLDMLVTMLADAAAAGLPIALGFECPLYVPARDKLMMLTDARRDEPLAWTAGPGACVLASGLVVTSYVLRILRARVAGLSGTTKWAEFARGDCGLLVWEAFITSRDEPTVHESVRPIANEHERDAMAGALAFRSRCTAYSGPESDFGPEPSVSLAAMSLLHSGLSSDVGLLSDVPLVIRTGKPAVSEATNK
jgi:hypothetical protein